jgi:hypothetical protein
MMSGVDFDRYVEDTCLMGDDAQSPITQDQCIVSSQRDPSAVLFERMLALIVGDVRPCKGARIRMLGL